MNQTNQTSSVTRKESQELNEKKFRLGILEKRLLVIPNEICRCDLMQADLDFQSSALTCKRTQLYEEQGKTIREVQELIKELKVEPVSVTQV